MEEVSWNIHTMESGANSHSIIMVNGIGNVLMLVIIENGVLPQPTRLLVMVGQKHGGIAGIDFHPSP